MSLSNEFVGAACCNDVAMLDKMLGQGGVDINEPDGLGRTALIAASARGHVASVAFLLASKANVELHDRGGFTALHRAAGEGHLNVVNLLLDHGADVNARSKGRQTPLHMPAGRGHTEVVRLLIDRGADVNAQDESLETPLMHAVEYPRLSTVEALLKAGARTDIKYEPGKTVYDLASTQSSYAMLDAYKTNNARSLVSRTLDMLDRHFPVTRRKPAP